jgi:hypothetical protein
MPKCTESYQRCGAIRIEVHDEGPGITLQGKLTLFHEGVQLNPNQLQSGQGERRLFSPLLTSLSVSLCLSLSLSLCLSLSLSLCLSLSLSLCRLRARVVDLQGDRHDSRRLDRCRM